MGRSSHHPINVWRHHKTIVWNVVEGKFPGLHVRLWRCFRYPFRTDVSSGGLRRNVSERSKLWLPATKSRIPWARTAELPNPSTDWAPMVEATSLRPLALPAQLLEGPGSICNFASDFALRAIISGPKGSASGISACASCSERSTPARMLA